MGQIRSLWHELELARGGNAHERLTIRNAEIAAKYGAPVYLSAKKSLGRSFQAHGRAETHSSVPPRTPTRPENRVNDTC